MARELSPWRLIREYRGVAYCTQQDVEFAAGGRANLNDLCDLARSTTDPLPAEALQAIAQAIADADALINSYLGKVRAVPLSQVPPVVRRVAAEEAVFVLRSRRQFGAEDLAKHEANVRWLEQVARGLVTLGVDPQPAASALVMPTVVERTDRESTAARLRGLW